MKSKEDVYQILNHILESNILTKEEMLDIFMMILRNHFSIEEMLAIMNSTGAIFPKTKGKHKSKSSDKKEDILSYPSVVGIPLSLVYEKIFKK